MGASKLVRAAQSVLVMSVLGILFRRPHRWLPATVQVGSTGFCVASLMFVLAVVLRHGVLGGESLTAIAIGCGLSYGVLLLVSLGDWVAEFILYLCVSVGIDLTVSFLLFTGLMPSDSGLAQSGFFLWQLVATFVAMVQLRLTREPASVS